MSNYRAILLALFTVVPFAFAQNPVPTSSGNTSAKPLAFEVVSIRPSKPGTNMMTRWSTTPDGYRVTGQTLWSTFMIAYFPQGLAYWSKERVSGAPSWFNDQYDIDAKVSEADLPEWQKQGLGLQRVPMLREMLQSMLAERCKLVVHRIPGEIDGYALVVGNRGPKLTASSPSATLPAVGMKLPDGGIAVGSNRGEPLQWTYHSASMADLVSMLSMGSPIVDRTGLSGHYDFVLRCAESDHPDAGCGSGNGSDIWDWSALGLRVERIKLPLDTLVIDHIEKPSEN
jgi:uncharacterized protein (TIGR03435 family)